MNEGMTIEKVAGIAKQMKEMQAFHQDADVLYYPHLKTVALIYK